MAARKGKRSAAKARATKSPLLHQSKALKSKTLSAHRRIHKHRNFSPLMDGLGVEHIKKAEGTTVRGSKYEAHLFGFPKIAVGLVEVAL